MANELKYSDNMNLFSHVFDSTDDVHPPEVAARWLVAFQAFALGGTITTEEGKKKVDGSADAGQLVKSAVVVARGRNPFETLVLNLVQYSAEEEKPFAFDANADMPAWERDEKTEPRNRNYDGYLDLLTWQSRRVRLIPLRDTEGQLLGVSGVVAMKGFQLPDGYSRHQRETMVGFAKARDPKPRDDPWPPLGLRANRGLWRDSHASFQSIHEKTERPAVLSWINDLQQAACLERKEIQLDVFGMCAYRASIFFWRHETLPLPLSYLKYLQLLESLKDALRLAERVARILRTATYQAIIQIKKDLASTKPEDGTQALDFTDANDRLPKRRPDPSGNHVKSLAPERDYWAQLEPRFRRLLEELALSTNPDGRVEQLGFWFHQSLGPLAHRAYGVVVRSLSLSQREMHGAAVGERYLCSRLRRLGKKYPTPGTRETEVLHV